jgi:hypothetical protein
MAKARTNRLFDRLIDHWDVELQKAFNDAVQNMRKGADIQQIARMLESGDVAGAVSAVGLDPVQFRKWDATIGNAFEAGGNATARLIPVTRNPQGFRTVIQFSVRNQSAEQWLSAHSSKSITEILEDQRNMIREHLTDGMAKGLNPRTASLDLVGRIGASGRREGGTLGLTSSQAEWVRNYRDELASDAPGAALNRTLRDKRFDGAVRRAAEEGAPVPAELREKMVTSYKNRALKFRAEAIARTESMAALHQSQDEAMRQGISQGAIEKENVEYMWHATHDDRTRDSHRVMDGQVVKQDEPFITGNGVALMYPGDPNGPADEVINCRCWREPVVDFLAGVK